jgi:Na+-transporting methylmalonyl-CoA/oxaloacetate decarboxylase gamma subunit
MPETESILATGSLLLFAGVTYVVLFHKIPADNEKYAMLMLGALIGIVKDTFGRYFQATKGAQEQRKEAASVARTLAETAATVATVAAAKEDNK